MKGSIVRSMSWGDSSPATARHVDWDADMPSQRRYRRWITDFEAFIDVEGQSHACRVSDISPAGVRVRLMGAAGVPVGTQLVFDLDGWGQVPAVVRHSGQDVLGIEFLLVEGEEVELARWLVTHSPKRRQARQARSIEASLRHAGETHACRVTDISRTGARVDLARVAEITVASEVTLLLPGQDPITASVRYAEDTSLGLNFHVVHEGDLPS